MKRFLVLLSSIIITFPSVARPAADSTAVKSSDFNAKQLIAPAALLTGGVVIHCFAHNTVDVGIRSWTQDKWRAGGPERNFDDYLQYAPLAMHLGLGFTGIKTEHCFIDRAIESALGHAALGILSWGMKNLIDSPRPNLVDNKSFPSGHASISFMNAELVRMEYGWAWGAGAYALAATVGVMRVYNDWHWTSDVLCGAGLGILCAHVGGWLLEPTKRLFGIRLPEKWQFGAIPVLDPLSNSYGATLALRF